MNTGTGNRKDLYIQMRVDENLESYLAETRRMEGKCFHDIQCLPPVNPDGSSPCSTAENQYARADKDVELLRHRKTILTEYMVAIEQRRTQLGRELAAMETDARELKLGCVQEEYQKAREAQMARMREVSKKKQAITQLMELIERTLVAASFRRWPLGKPAESMPPFVAGPGASLNDAYERALGKNRPNVFSPPVQGNGSGWDPLIRLSGHNWIAKPKD